MSSTNRKLRRNTIRYVANVSAIAQGCRCDRIIKVHGVDRVQIQHDDWCVMRYVGRQYVLYKLPRGCDR